MNGDRLELARMAFAQLSKTERRELLRTFTPAPIATPTEAPAPRIIRRAETARRLARSPRAVDRLAAAGFLRRVILPGRTRGAGFVESDVCALLEART
jgi:hypothetical protein